MRPLSGRCAAGAGARGIAGVGALAGYQLTVVWQLPQSSVVGTCPKDLPNPLSALWQLWQVPASPTWLKRAGRHAIVPWQLLQSRLVGIWLIALPVVTTPL